MAAGNRNGWTTATAMLVGLIGMPAVAAPLPKPPAFAVCGVCHKAAEGEKPTIGPNLWGVGGRKSGTQAGYTYSPAMKAANITWTKDELTSFITDPKKRVPGTKMAYAGLKDEKRVGDLIAYLHTFDTAPVSLVK